MADYYVGNKSDGTAGSDVADGLTFANRLATIAAAIAKITSAGDRIIVTAPAEYPLTDAQTTIGAITGPTANQPLIIIGANSANGTIDGSLAWRDGANTVANAYTDNGVARSNIWFVSLGFTRFTSSPVLFTNTSSANISIIACRAQTNGSYAFRLLNGYCSVFDSTVIGSTANGGIQCNGNVQGCTIRSCTGVGVATDSANWGPSITNNVIASCTSHGVSVASSTGATNIATVISSNTINGCGGNAINFTNDDGFAPISADYNILSNNTGYAIATSGTAVGAFYGNHYYNNAGNTSGFSIPTWYTSSETSGDPLYRDASTFDFTPKLGSPALRTDREFAGAVAPLGSGGTRTRGPSIGL